MNADLWQERTIDPQTLVGPDLDFSTLLTEFSNYQESIWPRLARARLDLQQALYREIDIGGDLVTLQWNPGRVASSTARVDPASIQARPCFLCAANLPPEERALPFGRDYLILCNPAPLFERHLVIAHRDHRPQELGCCLVELMRLARMAGKDWSVLYNGPKAGASAPDHLHLQVFPSGRLPLEARLMRALRENQSPPGRMILDHPAVRVWSATGLGRAAWFFYGDPDTVELGVEAAREILSADLEGQEHPLNLVLHAEGDQVLAMLMARAAHRPRRYFLQDPERVVVSPGSVDMAGFFIVVRRQDFERLDGALLREIYLDVSAKEELLWDLGTLLGDLIRTRAPRA